MNKENIIFANSEAYNNANFSEGLTSYCAGLPVDTRVQSILDFIAPPVPVAHRFEFDRLGDGVIVVDADDARDVGAPFKVVNVTGEKVQEKLVNRGLSMVIDDDEWFANYQEQAVKALKNRLLANELFRAVSLAKTAAGEALSKTWKAGDGTNPDMDIRKLVSSVGEKGGINANRVLIGECAWTYRLDSLLGSEATASGSQAQLSPQNLAAFVGAEKLFSCDQRFETKVKDNDNKAAKTYTAFLSNYVIAFNARDGVTKFDPSTFKRFVNEGGFKVYVEKKTKRTVVTVEHYSRLAQTGVGACKCLTIANA